MISPVLLFAQPFNLIIGEMSSMFIASFLYHEPLLGSKLICSYIQFVIVEMVQVGVCSFVNLVNICLRHVAAFLAIYTFNHCFLLHWFPHTQQINLSDLSFFSLSWEYSRDVAVVVSLPLVTGVQI